jgi:hypothetical protein
VGWAKAEPCPQLASEEGTLVGQPLRETNGETAVREGKRLDLSTDMSVREDLVLVAAFGQERPRPNCKRVGNAY